MMSGRRNENPTIYGLTKSLVTISYSKCVFKEIFYNFRRLNSRLNLTNLSKGLLGMRTFYFVLYFQE